MPRLFATAALCSTLVLLPACCSTGENHSDAHMHGEMQQTTHAICVLSSTANNTVTGWVADNADDRNIVFAIQDGDIDASWFGSALLGRLTTHHRGWDGVVQGGKVYGGAEVGAGLVGELLGIEVQSSLFDQVRTCDNHCSFCFIYQLPAGMRKSLSLKDDDFRLSFLYGNFTTLTRFTESDLERVLTEKLSPLYVSIHATNRDRRSELFRFQDRRRPETPCMASCRYPVRRHRPYWHRGQSHKALQHRPRWRRIRSIPRRPTTDRQHRLRRCGFVPELPQYRRQTPDIRRSTIFLPGHAVRCIR